MPEVPKHNKEKKIGCEIVKIFHCDHSVEAWPTPNLTEHLCHIIPGNGTQIKSLPVFINYRLCTLKIFKLSYKGCLMAFFSKTKVRICRLDIIFDQHLREAWHAAIQ